MHKKTQIKKIKIYRKGLYFDIWPIIISSILCIYLIVEFFISDYIIDKIYPKFHIYKNEIFSKDYITGILPKILISLLTWEITHDDFSDKVLDSYLQSVSLLNNNSNYYLKHSKIYSKLSLLFFLRNGRDACNYLMKLGNYKNEDKLIDFCVNGFYFKGVELGINEYLSKIINHYNFVIFNNSYITEEDRIKILNNQTILAQLDFNYFIQEKIYSGSLNELSNFLIKEIEKIENAFLIRFFIVFIILTIIFIIFVSYITTKFLHSDI